MLTPAQIANVRRLLDRCQYSQREIARRLGISRCSVRAIARGLRAENAVYLSDEGDLLCRLPPKRCRDCGGMVHGVCRLCRARDIQARRKRATNSRAASKRGCGSTEILSCFRVEDRCG